MARILVIDDEDGFREAVKEMLERAGHEVIEASNGRAGIDAYRQTPPPDLVITDILMPVMDGAETIFALNKEFPSVKIIAMSGGGVGAPEDYLREIASFSNLKRTLTKPFGMDELLNIVKETLEDD